MEELEIDKSDFNVWENNKITKKYKEFMQEYLNNSKEFILSSKNLTVTDSIKDIFYKGQVEILTELLNIKFDDLF